jgi:hypothetical protein
MRVRGSATAWLTAAGLAITGGPSLAHHSFSIFDMSLPTEIEGTVEEFRFTNPHALLLLKAKDSDGRVTSWRLEGASTTELGRDGWSPRTLKPGDQITMTIWPVRGASGGGTWDPKRVHFRDGKAVAASR